MTNKSEFLTYLMELLEPFGEISSKSMFGGYGIFKQGLMFGLVIDDILYFKTDDFNRFEFERLNLKPLVYLKKNKPALISYYKAPDEALDNSYEMLRWAQLAFDAALRTKK